MVEGADGSGRSTQIARLVDWLETSGHATVQVGLKRSTLVSSELEKAQEGNILSRTTLSLFYATDFADQLENIILPALKAGFIVLADRYIYTLMARDMVRGMDEAWLKNLYGIALEPDAVFYLEVGAGGTGAAQPFQKARRWIIWESGMDLGLSRDMFDSFLKYQMNDAGRVPPIAKDLRLHHRGRQPLRGYDHGSLVGGNSRVARGKIENINGPAAEPWWWNRRMLIGGNAMGVFVDAGGLRGESCFISSSNCFLCSGVNSVRMRWRTSCETQPFQRSRLRSWPSAMIFPIFSRCSGVRCKVASSCSTNCWFSICGRGICDSWRTGPVMARPGERPADFRVRAFNVIDEQTARHHATAKNHHGGQNDFPGIHCAWSLWSTEASSVFSKFCERSVESDEAAGLKKTHAPSNNAIATQEAAACQSLRAHNTHLSAPVRDASNAITRFSKA